jgi:hypothetical protein
MFGYFVALLIVGWAGGFFWLQGGTEHLNSYLVLMLGLALTETGDSQAGQDSSGPPDADGQGLDPFAP